MDVFDLAAKISLDSSPFEKGLDRAKGKMSAFGDVFKANIASDVVSKGFSAITSGVTKAVGGLKTLVSESTNAFGEYQQMVGGVQKLYGNMGKNLDDYAASVGKRSSEVRGEFERNSEAEKEVLKNAKNAYKEAGMSANEYMNTATQFSASLISSLGGDTKKAADQTQVAMTAISDNVNTFGSNMEDVTNAFKGFSKQNYTMLDNLKLGYGGTKKEMEQLIKDANEYGKTIGLNSKLSIDSFSDIVTAIELIQKKQHIYGTTAREAATTLQGSMGMVKAAWENLKTSIGSGEDLETNINNLVDSLVGHAATAEDVAVGTATKIGEHVHGLLDNLLPTIETSLKGIGNLIEKAAPIISEKLPALIEAIVPPMLSAVGTLASTVIQALPGIVNSIEQALSESMGGIFDPSSLMSKVSDLIVGLSDAVTSLLPNIINVGASILTALIQGIAENADKLLDGAAQIIEAFGNGIIENLPLIVSAVVQLLDSFSTYITEHKDELQSGIEALVDALVQGIITLTPSLADAALAIVTALGGALIDSIPQIVEQLPVFVSEIFSAINDAWTTASPDERVALAAVLAPIITGGIGDAINAVSAGKDILGKGGSILSKIFEKVGGAGGLDKADEVIDLSDLDIDEGKIGAIDKLKTALAGLKDGLSGIGGSALDGLKSLGGLLGNLATTVGSGLLSGIQTIGSFITSSIVPGIATLATTLAPFLPLILGIAAAITGVILVVKNWDKISKALQAGWESLKGAASKVFGGIKDTVSGAWDKIKTSTSEKWKSIKGEVEKNGGGIKGVIKTAAEGYLKPWRDGFEALNKASGGKLGEAVQGVKKNLEVMKAKFKAHNAAMKVVAKGLVNKVKEGWKGIKEAGGNFVKGLWEGVNNKVEWVKEKMAGFGKKVLGALKDFFKIKSPSRVMRDQIGKNLALGVAKGIEIGTPAATKASDKLAKSIFDSMKKTTTKNAKGVTKTIAGTATKSVLKYSETYLDQYRKQQDAKISDWLKKHPGADQAAQEQRKALDARIRQMRKATRDVQVKTTKQVTTAGKKQTVKLSGADLDNAYIKAVQKRVTELKKANKITKAEESSLWVSVANTVTKGGKAYKTALSKVKAASKDARKSLMDDLQKAIDNYAALHNGRELTLAEEKAFWKQSKSYFKKGTEEWLTAQKNYLDKKAQLQDQEKQANETLKSSLQSAEQTYQQALQTTIDKVNQRKQTLLSSFQLFEKYDIGTGISKSTLMDNLQSQLDALSTWREQVADLGKRIGGTKLFEEIQEMGVQGYQQVVALNTMTDEELKKYADTYHQRNVLAGEQAKEELAPTVQKESEAALKDYMKNVSDAWGTYKSTMDDMGIKVTGLTKSINDSVEKAGTNYTKVLDKMNLTTQDKTAAITSVLTAGISKTSQKTKKYGADLVQNFIDGIQSKEKDLTDAVQKSIAKVVKKNVGFLEPEEGPLADFHSYAPDMIDLFVKGISDNGYKIGEAFDRSLGLSDLSSRIGEGIFAPAVQAAGNSLHIAGLPNLTEIAGQNNNSGNQPTNLHVTLKVGRTEFAKMVYQLGKEEEQRVGLNLATGAI